MASNTPSEMLLHLSLPYKGWKGEAVIKKFKKLIMSTLPGNPPTRPRVIPRVIYKGKKLGSCFRLKDNVSDNHKFDIVYGFKVPGMPSDTQHYVGETSVRHGTRMYQHAHSDKKSAIYKHSHRCGYTATPSNFQILASGYHTKFERRICESLFVKDNKPFLNVQKNSLTLELFT